MVAARRRGRKNASSAPHRARREYGSRQGARMCTGPEKRPHGSASMSSIAAIDKHSGGSSQGRSGETWLGHKSGAAGRAGRPRGACLRRGPGGSRTSRRRSYRRTQYGDPHPFVTPYVGKSVPERGPQAPRSRWPLEAGRGFVPTRPIRPHRVGPGRVHIVKAEAGTQPAHPPARRHRERSPSQIARVVSVDHRIGRPQRS